MMVVKIILAGLYLLTICECLENNVSMPIILDNVTKNELNNRVNVSGGMGNNITLISSIPLGVGQVGVVLAGETENHILVAIKLFKTQECQEFNCYKALKATDDRICESYGIPYVYHHGRFLEYEMLVLTRLDINLESLQKQIGSFSKDNILIIARDLVKTLKFMHSKDVIHVDIKPPNMMVKGANVYLCDMSQCHRKNSEIRYRKGSRQYGSIASHRQGPSVKSDDMESMYYSLLTLADVKLPWFNLTSRDEILALKLRTEEVKNLTSQVQDPEIADLFSKFYIEMDEARQQNRSIKYDYLYGIFNDALYAGRNRNDRIVFDWLTPDEVEKAKAENVTSIESIVFDEDE